MLKKVLVVEDSPLLRSMLHDSLKKSGYLVYEAANGRSGLSSAKEVRPDIILLDVIMPIMDGMQMYAELQKQEGGSLIPVIMLTTSEDDEVLSWIKEKGLEFIKKNNQAMEEIPIIIERILSQK
jgi:DNA-binding response OmpR family regulator